MKVAVSASSPGLESPGDPAQGERARISPEEELAVLKKQADDLRRQVELVSKRIAALEKIR